MLASLNGPEFSLNIGNYYKLIVVGGKAHLLTSRYGFLEDEFLHQTLSKDGKQLRDYSVFQLTKDYLNHSLRMHLDILDGIYNPKEDSLHLEVHRG